MTSFKSLKLSQKVSEDARRQLSAVSNDTAVSQGPQKSASSAAKLIETVSTPASSEYQSSRNLTVLDGGPSSLWSRKHLSEMSVDSDMLRVSEPTSMSSRDLGGFVRDTASAVEVISVSHGENVVFPSVVETASDRELRRTQLDKTDDEDEITYAVEAAEITNTDHQSELRYPRRDEDVLNSTAEIASSVQIAKDSPDETGVEYTQTSVEQMFEAPSDSDMVSTQNAGSTEGIESCIQTDIIAKHVTHDLGMEADTTSMTLPAEVPTAEVEVAENIADEVGKETAVVQMSDSTAYEESLPVVRSGCIELEKVSVEDLPASQAPVDVIDVLPLSELPSAVDEAIETETKVTPIQKGETLDSTMADDEEAVEIEIKVTLGQREENLDSTMADDDHDTYSEWPPLPNDDELKIPNAELEPSSDDHSEYSENKDTELQTASPQHDMSAGTESGMLTKVGTSEKVLTHADHLRDVDSMHRFW